MSPFLKVTLPLLVIVSLLAPVAIYLGNRPSPPAPPPIQQPQSPLSVLAEMPDWSALEAYQETITREDFVRLLTSTFTTGSAWRDFIEIGETEAHIRTDGGDSTEVLVLRFAKPGSSRPTPRQWKATDELSPAPPDKPLQDLRIAIDPGHIGGSWARLEERWLRIDDGPPICEGDMTLLVAKLLKPRLEALGATVSLVRKKPEPVTHLRPDSFLDAASTSGDPEDSPAELQKTAERLFYRTAEIRARADLVNHTLQPDLVLCLHFNADPWGDPDHPTLVERTHFHLLLNGAYNDDEIRLADQRFAMLEKLLSRSHDEETLVATTIAATFAQTTGLPPFIYPPDSPNALPVADNPYLWSRNLLANRLYHCPVIFMEPYVMNSTIDFPRLQAGDYDGLREINGKPQPSIFREYADALTTALATHYSEKRGTSR